MSGDLDPGLRAGAGEARHLVEDGVEGRLQVGAAGIEAQGLPARQAREGLAAGRRVPARRRAAGADRDVEPPPRRGEAPGLGGDAAGALGIEALAGDAQILVAHAHLALGELGEGADPGGQALDEAGRRALGDPGTVDHPLAVEVRPQGGAQCRAGLGIRQVAGEGEGVRPAPDRDEVGRDRARRQRDGTAGHTRRQAGGGRLGLAHGLDVDGAAAHRQRRSVEGDAAVPHQGQDREGAVDQRPGVDARRQAAGDAHRVGHRDALGEEPGGGQDRGPVGLRCRVAVEADPRGPAARRPDEGRDQGRLDPDLADREAGGRVGEVGPQGRVGLDARRLAVDRQDAVAQGRGGAGLQVPHLRDEEAGGLGKVLRRAAGGPGGVAQDEPGGKPGAQGFRQGGAAGLGRAVPEQVDAVGRPKGGRPGEGRDLGDEAGPVEDAAPARQGGERRAGLAAGALARSLAARHEVAAPRLDPQPRLRPVAPGRRRDRLGGRLESRLEPRLGESRRGHPGTGQEGKAGQPADRANGQGGTSSRGDHARRGLRACGSPWRRFPASAWRTRKRAPARAGALRGASRDAAPRREPRIAT